MTEEEWNRKVVEVLVSDESDEIKDLLQWASNRLAYMDGRLQAHAAIEKPIKWRQVQ